MISCDNWAPNTQPVRPALAGGGDERQFSPKEIEALESLARQAAVAIHNARQYEQLERAGALLAAQLDLRQVLLEMSSTLLATLEQDDVFASIAALVKRVVDYDCLEVRLLDVEAAELYCAYASADDAEYLENWRCSLDEGVSGWVARHDEAQLVNDMRSDPRGVQVAGTDDEPQASILAPLTADGEVIGVLCLDRTEGRTFEKHELEAAKLFANLAAIAIRNARQYEHVQHLHANNLRTLSTALNAKDYYTLGHAARVAAYMNLLGKELGWSSEEVQRIGAAAYLHDIGKIGIPDRILTKAGKLNQREWELMRQHPALSADIIRPLYAEDVVLGVRHHHERYDGRGYPDGLAGEEIPLIARAMCVVDSYDAHVVRPAVPSRSQLPLTDCLTELERCKGSQFDPVMVDAFVQCWRTSPLGQAAWARHRRAGGSAHRRGRARGPRRERLRGRPSVLGDASHPARGARCEPRSARQTTLARRNGGQIIVCDAEEDENERSHLGEAMVSDEELPRILAGETPDICLVSADQYGVWISAMTPLTRSDGEIVGAVSVDFPAYETAQDDGLRDDATQALTRLLVGTSERVKSGCRQTPPPICSVGSTPTAVCMRTWQSSYPAPRKRARSSRSSCVTSTVSPTSTGWSVIRTATRRCA